MKIKIEKTVKPFSLPNFILFESESRERQDGVNFESEKISIKDADTSLLSALCDKFRADIFKKAGKVDPKEQQ